uniref:Small ribosomal subunit protein uS3c n=1 Tax=Nitella hyalina TaxID=181804 RepID=A0A2H4G6Y4_NITHY|nr:ribosomal protein S3 [Nitella hyalina]APP89424.1 ribosomal protein S3 [Nitella hyalina]WKT08448.1 ribosomal protein S3 [Nitella hyalina]
MGQKINPLGFRLGFTQQHHSHWFAKSNCYSILLEEDKQIRLCICNHIRNYVRSSSNYGGIARIDIYRRTDLVQLEIHTGFPALLIENRIRGLEYLRREIQKKIDYQKRKLRMTLIEVSKPYTEPTILAEYIALQLENRVAFRRVIKKAIQLAKVSNIKGIKIQIAGRLNGAEIARTEWVQKGRLPLQTLKAKINYSHYAANTIYGVLGIKVWIFQETA